MKCPNCQLQSKEIELTQKIVSENLVIDYCPQCNGVWLGQAELSQFVKRIEEYINGLELKEILNRKPQQVTSQSLTKDCPVCSAPLKTFNYAYDSNIFLDRCPSCNGIWADSGEIISIAKYIKGHPFLDAYGKSLAEYVQGQRELTEITEVTKTPLLTRRLGYSFFSFNLFPIPLSDTAPLTIIPYATLSLIGLNIIVFILMLTTSNIEYFYETYGLHSPINPLAIFSHQFLHAGWEHIIGNMFFLYLFGDNMEEALGHLKFLIFYLIVGALSGTTDILISGHPEIPRVGASGAISAIMGGYYLLFPKSKVKVFMWGTTFHIYAQFYFAFWIGYQILMAMLFSVTYASGIAWFAHISGFFGGMIIAYLLRKHQMINTNLETRG
jgi:membrane associated rhomboid family serine protease/Zn-finger nucleic acid-binding protein